MTDRGFKDGGHKDRHHLFTRIWGDITWQKDALCHGRMDWFFPERNSDNRNQGLTLADRKAKALCARCPVRRKCLEYGFEEEYGIWGGAMPSERRKGKDIDVLLDAMFEQAVRLGLVDREVA